MTGAAARRPIDQRRRARTRTPARAGRRAAGPASPGRPDAASAPKLSKDAYRRQTRGARRRADPARPAQEPPRAGDGRSVGRGQLRRAAPDLERAGRRRARPSRPPRMRGSSSRRGAVTRDRRSAPVRIGLTGPIGCGKSTVAALAGERGAVVVDADHVAREVDGAGRARLAAIVGAVRPGACSPRTARSTGRPSAGIVFADPAELRALEAIVHPAVRPRILAALDAAARDGRARPSSSRRSSSSKAGYARPVRRGLARRPATRRSSGIGSPTRGLDRTRRSAGSPARPGSSSGSRRSRPGRSTRAAPRRDPDRGRRGARRGAGRTLGRRAARPG